MYKILVVDDEPGIRFCLGMTGENLGHEMHMAANAEEALALLEIHDFHIMITDLYLKSNGLCGSSLILETKASRPDMKCVLMSAHGQSMQDGRIFQEDYFLGKPFLQTELERAILCVMADNELAC